MTSVPNRIEIQVTAKTTGWVGFGFSKTHSYTNADMVIGYVDDSNNELISHYVSVGWSLSFHFFYFFDSCVRITGQQVLHRFQH